MTGALNFDISQRKDGDSVKVCTAVKSGQSFALELGDYGV